MTENIENIQGMPVRLSTDFSTERLLTRLGWHDTFKIIRYESLYSGAYILVGDGEKRKDGCMRIRSSVILMLW